MITSAANLVKRINFSLYRLKMKDRKFGDLSGFLGPLEGYAAKYLYYILDAEPLETVLKTH